MTIQAIPENIRVAIAEHGITSLVTETGNGFVRVELSKPASDPALPPTTTACESQSLRGAFSGALAVFGVSVE